MKQTRRVLKVCGRLRSILYDSTFSRTVWRLYGGAKGLVMWYYRLAPTGLEEPGLEVRIEVDVDAGEVRQEIPAPGLRHQLLPSAPRAASASCCAVCAALCYCALCTVAQRDTVRHTQCTVRGAARCGAMRCRCVACGVWPVGVPDVRSVIGVRC